MLTTHGHDLRHWFHLTGQRASQRSAAAIFRLCTDGTVAAAQPACTRHRAYNWPQLLARKVFVHQARENARDDDQAKVEKDERNVRLVVLATLRKQIHYFLCLVLDVVKLFLLVANVAEVLRALLGSEGRAAGPVFVTEAVAVDVAAPSSTW